MIKKREKSRPESRIFSVPRKIVAPSERKGRRRQQRNKQQQKFSLLFSCVCFFCFLFSCFVLLYEQKDLGEMTWDFNIYARAKSSSFLPNVRTYAYACAYTPYINHLDFLFYFFHTSLMHLVYMQLRVFNLILLVQVFPHLSFFLLFSTYQWSRRSF